MRISQFMIEKMNNKNFFEALYFFSRIDKDENFKVSQMSFPITDVHI